MVEACLALRTMLRSNLGRIRGRKKRPKKNLALRVVTGSSETVKRLIHRLAKKSELEKLNFKTSAVYPGDRHPDKLFFQTPSHLQLL